MSSGRAFEIFSGEHAHSICRENAEAGILEGIESRGGATYPGLIDLARSERVFDQQRLLAHNLKQKVASLNGRQRLVLQLLVRGHRARAVASLLGLQSIEVRQEVSAILRAFDVSTQLEVVALVHDL